LNFTTLLTVAKATIGLDFMQLAFQSKCIFATPHTPHVSNKALIFAFIKDTGRKSVRKNLE
jgi:hypothetical protein